MRTEQEKISSENARFVGKLPGEEPSFVLSVPKGRTLTEMLETDSLMGSDSPLRGRLSLALELCSLIGYLHQNGIVHRDLTPDHVVLGESGGVYLKGLERAKYLGSPELPKKDLPAFIGTPGYAAPEQLRNPADVFEVRSDLFSFGAILYELITGQRAFQAANHLALILQTIEKQPQPPSKLSSSCTGGLDALCASLLSKQREKRPSSVEEVARLLSVCIKELHNPIVRSPSQTSVLSGKDLPSEPSMPPGRQGEIPPSPSMFGHKLPSFSEEIGDPGEARSNKPSLTPSKENGVSTGRLQGFALELGGSLPTVNQEFYEVEGEMARGGLGKILKAKDTRLGRPVAVKELLRDQGNAKARFLREALITSRLQHPAIVPIYEAGRWPSGELFYTMKLVSGRPLDKLIAEADSLEKRLALLPNAQVVCEAMAYAHDQRVIHRDLKPQNVLVGDYGETVVIDWGLAKDLKSPHEDEKDEADEHYRAAAQKEGLTITGEVMGTPAYMPMEQAKGQPVDERADVYALGAMLYHILTGQPPYRDKATRSREVLWALLQGPPMPIKEKVKDAPPDLIAIVNKAMEREPEKRYATAKELAHELQKFQTGQLVGAHQYTFSELVSRFMKKNKTAVMVGAGLAALLVFVTSYYFVKINIESSAKDAALIAKEKSAREAMEQANEARKQEAEAKKQRHIAEENAQQLTLRQARSELGTDPAAALLDLAKIKDIPTFKESARIIEADAFARGVSRVLHGSMGPIFWSSLSPDRRFLVAASNDKIASLCDLLTSECSVIAKHEEGLRFATFSPDAKMIATTSYDKTVGLWDVATKKQLFLLKGHTEFVNVAAFSPDGKILASSSRDTTIRLWDVSTGKELKVLVGDGQPSGSGWLTFSKDGAVLASGYDNGELRLWDIKTGASRLLSGHTDGVSRMALSPDGELLASSGLDGQVILWRLSTGQKLKILTKRKTEFWSVAFSPDGSRVVAAGGGAVILWDVATGEEVGSVSPSVAFFNQASFSSDGSLLAFSGADHYAYLWEPRTGLLWPLKGHTGNVRNVSFTLEDWLFSTSLDGTARLWNTHELQGEILYEPKADEKMIAASPSFDQLLIEREEHTLALLALTTKEERTLGISNSPIESVAFSLDHKQLALFMQDQTIQLWDVAAQTSRPLESIARDTIAKDNPAKLVFSSDGSLLVAGTKDSTIQIWSTKSGERLSVLTGQKMGISAVAISPDNKYLATASSDLSTRLWELSTGESQTVVTGRFYESICFSPDGHFLFGSGNLSVLDELDISQHSRREFKGGTDGQIWSVAVSPDGRTVATAGVRGLFIWSVESEEQRSLAAQKEFLQVSFSSDNQEIIALDAENRIRVFANAPLPFLERPQLHTKP